MSWELGIGDNPSRRMPTPLLLFRWICKNTLVRLVPGQATSSVTCSTYRIYLGSPMRRSCSLMSPLLVTLCWPSGRCIPFAVGLLLLISLWCLEGAVDSCRVAFPVTPSVVVPSFRVPVGFLFVLCRWVWIVLRRGVLLYGLWLWLGLWVIDCVDLTCPWWN